MLRSFFVCRVQTCPKQPVRPEEPAEGAKKEDIMASKYDGLARIIIQNVGGKGNVISLTPVSYTHLCWRRPMSWTDMREKLPFSGRDAVRVNAGTGRRD